jgi:hypothetical protein
MDANATAGQDETLARSCKSVLDARGPRETMTLTRCRDERPGMLSARFSSPQEKVCSFHNILGLRYHPPGEPSKRAVDMSHRAWLLSAECVIIFDVRATHH